MVKRVEGSHDTEGVPAQWSLGEYRTHTVLAWYRGRVCTRKRRDYTSRINPVGVSAPGKQNKKERKTSA